MPAEVTSAPISAPPAAPFQPPQALLDSAHAKLLGHSDIQFHFTAAPAIPKPHVPAWLEWIAKLFRWAEPAFQFVFWAGVAAIVGLILFLIARELGFVRWTRRGKASAKIAPYQPDAETARVLLADADALAAQGLFAQAVHVLLQRSIEDLRQRRPRAVGPAYTSREIAVLPALPERVRPAFAAMAELVESSLFGGRAVVQAEFARARAAYEDFAYPQGWS